MKSSSQRWLGLLGLVLFAGILYYAGLETWQQILRADIRYLLLAFGVNIILMTSSSVRWGLLTNAVVGRKVCSYLNYFYYLVLGRVLGLFVSFNLGDYAVRPLALRATNTLSTGRMVYALVLDKLFDLLLAAGFLIPTLLFQLDQVERSAYFFTVLVILVILYLLWERYEPLLQILFHFFARWRGGLLRRNQRVAQWLDVISSGQGLVGQKTIRMAYGLTIVRFALLTLYHYLVSVALHLPFSYLDFWMILPVIQLSLILAFTPGALGILELGWLGVLTWLGADQTAVNAFVVGQRIFFLIFTLIVGLLMSPWMLLTRREAKT